MISFISQSFEDTHNIERRSLIEIKRQQILECCHYTMITTFSVACTVTLIHYLQDKPGNPIVRGSFCFAVALCALAVKLLLGRVKGLEKWTACILLSAICLAMTEQSFYLYPSEYKVSPV